VAHPPRWLQCECLVAWASSSANCVSRSSPTPGTALFSGSLYGLVLTEYRKLGAITPVGGLLYVAGWLALLWQGAL